MVEVYPNDKVDVLLTHPKFQMVRLFLLYLLLVLLDQVVPEDLEDPGDPRGLEDSLNLGRQ